MEHFAGLDVSVKETSVCIVDDAGMMEGPWCRFRREARARGRHRYRLGGLSESA